MFDVVIPLGKAHENSSESIRSALVQQNISSVCVVVNGGFPAALVPELKEEFKDTISKGKLKIICDYSLQNGNQARNLGVAQGNAPWVAFLDSDDTWVSGWLPHVAEQIQDHPEVEFFYGSVRRVTKDGKEEILKASDWREFFTPEHYITSGGCSQTSALVVRRKLLDAVRWRPLVTRRQDRFFFMDIVRHGAITRPIEQAFVNVFRDARPRVFRSADLAYFLLEIVGQVPLRKLLSLTRGFISSNWKNPLLMCRLIFGLITIKHVDWYIRSK